VGTAPASFTWDVDVSGNYMPPADPGVVAAIYIDPTPQVMKPGDTQKLAVRARYGTCENGADLTGEAQLSSSVPAVATWAADGTVTALAVGTTGLSATARDKTVNYILVVNPAPPQDSGCSVVPHAGPSWIIFLLGTVPAFAFRPSRAAGRSRP